MCKGVELKKNLSLDSGGVQNKPDDLKFMRPYNRIRFDLTSKMTYTYVKTIWTQADFKPIRNT